MDRLAELRREIEREHRFTATPTIASQAHHRIAKVPLRVVLPLVAVLAVLPFFVLLRGSTFLYSHRGWPSWVAVGGAVTLTLGVLTAYAAFLSKRLTGRSRVRFVATWIAAPLVIAYSAHGLLFLASVNTKTPAVRAYYRSLHPTMRLAISTFVILDPGLVVTDIHRTPADYAAMGLPVYESSLHFQQEDGLVHAMDLRTIGRGAVRNWLTAQYFRTLGFRTLRHVGTADHLHVSLPVN
jgi:hypothetical protein